jgi:hypothetical protein
MHTALIYQVAVQILTQSAKKSHTVSTVKSKSLFLFEAAVQFSRNATAVYGWLVEIKLIIMHAPEDDALPVIEHEQEAVQILRQQHSAVIVSVVA